MAKISFLNGDNEINLDDALPDLVWSDDISIVGKTRATSELPTKGGLLRIRWARNSTLLFPRQAIVNVSYGYSSQNERQLKVISGTNEDILYIGKAQDIRERIFRIFSIQRSSNSTARKIAALLVNGTQQQGIDNLDDCISNIRINIMLIPNPLQRDFMKALALSDEKPCLNIGLEH